ncbi:MAG: hypothetical protein MSH12_12715, partial [Romboutsia timonensis]|nr:hypothetical protein [Romboutsia timonensis]
MSSLDNNPLAAFGVSEKIQLNWFEEDEKPSLELAYGRQSLMKEYFQTRFYHMLEEDKATLKDNMCVAIQCFRNEIAVQQAFFNNIDELVKFVCYDEKLVNCDIYIKGLINNTDKGLTDEHIVKRADLVFDFDNKDKLPDGVWTAREIDKLFTALNIKYTLIVQSGNGLHVYVTLNNVSKDNLYKVKEVNQSLVKILGSDPMVVGLSHLIRVPGTFNNKTKRKYVTIVKNSAKTLAGVIDFEAQRVYGYDINDLYKNFVEEANNKYITKAERVNNKPKSKRKLDIGAIGISNCEYNWMSRGVTKGGRNNARAQLFSILLYRGLDEDAIKEQILKFNSICVPAEKESIVIEQVKYLWKRSVKNGQSGAYVGCDVCTDISCCYKGANVKYEAINELESIDYDWIKYNKKTQLNYCRKGLKKSMDAKEFLVLSMITYWKKLSYDKLVKELSYKKKCKYTDRTLRGILKSLIDKGHIEEKDG